MTAAAPPRATPPRRPRRGGRILALTGLVYGVGLALRGPPLPDVREAGWTADGFAATAGSTGYRLGWTVLIAGTVLLVFGYLALHEQFPDRGRSLPPTVLTVAGLVVSVGLFGVFALAYPAVAQRHAQGATGTAELVATIVDGTRPYSTAGGALLLVGLIWFAVVVRRAGGRHRWAGTLLPVYYLLLLAPVFPLGTTPAYALEFLGAGLLATAGLLSALGPASAGRAAPGPATGREAVLSSPDTGPEHRRG